MSRWKEKKTKRKTKIVWGHFEKCQPFCFGDKSAMALYLKIFVRLPLCQISNFYHKVLLSAQFPQIMRIPLPLFEYLSHVFLP